ncbi:Ser/Thr protein phosphatase superfamily protein [Cantharellus anzutake]|uniref:Ser/Thr protein phosphatase superfamily protein n=1 Tax=Cantharellus anzutake TaxID=1750568 RepID=UPI001907071B|nr:Ser/Thr protein phosphatase superfamily protein [Cantharellus anzutake]KAF8335291.1 Ser/Thr protein phosphatase superfamily protein [Cantharellus anzutake]
MPSSIQVLSDIHLEIERSQDTIEYETFKVTPVAPILALLGDIGTANDPRLFEFIRTQLHQFKAVLYVLGNHEFYWNSYDSVTKAFEDFEDSITAERASGSSPTLGEFVLMNRRSYSPGPETNTIILGCTLWSALNPADLEFLIWGLNDFRAIKGMNPEVFCKLHEEEISWLRSKIERIKIDFPEKDIVVLTHHAPTVDGTANPKYKGGPTNSAFATELTGEGFWGEPIKTWAFGHTHWTCDFVRGGIRVVSNQRGYKHRIDEQAKPFDGKFVIEMG